MAWVMLTVTRETEVVHGRLPPTHTPSLPVNDPCWLEPSDSLGTQLQANRFQIILHSDSGQNSVMLA